MEKPKRYTITAALPYANGPFHLGHICGAYLPSDIYARYLRSKGEDVVYVCGSDEHGAAITLRARKEGVSPQEIVDKYHAMLKDAADRFGLSFDIYDRTSAEHHHKTAQDFFLKLYENDSFTKEVSEQFYDEENQQFLADRYITGECPKCHYPEAYGDQCEKCGSSLSPSDLINPKSTLSGKPPVLKETWHFYLPMERHEDWLRDYITEGKLEGEQHHDPAEWKNHVKGQCLSWIDGGLRPRAMTRDLDWGVPVPLKDAEGKVLYVWLDAPIGYISATKKWAEEKGEDWEKWWKDDDTKLVHFIGKDNIVFHCIIFPILLKEHGEFRLPDNVPANEFLNLEGDKLSTSRGWAVWLHEYLDEFEGQEDVMRYVLASILPETRDSEFTWKDYQARNNNELVAILGNFVNRALVLTQKYYDGEVPGRDENNVVSEHQKSLVDILGGTPDKVGGHIQSYRFREALSEAMNLARTGNKFLADTEPWKLIKQDPEAVKTIMNLALQVCANLTIVLDPFLPFTTEKLRSMLGMEKLSWESAGSVDLIKPGHVINKPSLLFSKVEDETIEKQVQKLKDRRAEADANKIDSSKHKPMKPEISFDDFTKMDIRVGEIKSAEKVENADKLLKLTVDVGLDVRTVVSGIAEHYKPEDIVGKKVSVLLNLAPRKIRGVESQGMVLMAENENGELAFVSPGSDMEVGAEVR